MQRPRLSLSPGTVIGVVGGRPVYNIAGGSGEGGGDTGGDTAGTDAGAADTKAENTETAAKAAAPPKPTEPAKPAAKSDAGDGAQEAEDISSLPVWAQKVIKDARGESAKDRTEAKKAAADEARAGLVQELGKALGLVKDEKDTPPDPAKLTAEIERAQAAHRETAIELAVYKGAAAHGADPAALTDSRQFLGTLAKLDPAADSFTAKVGSAIEKAVKDHPKLSAQGQAPERVSGEFSGGTGDKPPTGTRSIDDIRDERRKRRAG